LKIDLATPDVERVVAAVESISGDRAKAVEWLSQPLDTFGGLGLTQETDDLFFGKAFLHVQSPSAG